MKGQLFNTKKLLADCLSHKFFTSSFFNQKNLSCLLIDTPKPFWIWLQSCGEDFESHVSCLPHHPGKLILQCPPTPLLGGSNLPMCSPTPTLNWGIWPCGVGHAYQHVPCVLRMKSPKQTCMYKRPCMHGGMHEGMHFSSIMNIPEADMQASNNAGMQLSISYIMQLWK